LAKIIENFAAIKAWGIIKDGKATVGAMGGKNSISLEPGSQFEVSLEPKLTVCEIQTEMLENLKLLNNIAKIYDTTFLPYGIAPLSWYKNIELMPKKRYLIMADYFKKNALKFAPVMMRETAGVQVNFDYKSGADAILKLRACALISPFLTGFFANSPIRGGKLTPYKSFRALAWKYTDDVRCGFFYQNLLKNRFGLDFEDYIDNILKVPMLFIERNNQKIVIGGKINFEQFMRNGYEGYYPDLTDYILHASLVFPDIRLKNCIEIRNHDSQNLPLTLAICAFYKGVLHKESNVMKILEMLRFSADEVREFGFKSAKYGLSYDVVGKSAFDVALELFEMAYDGPLLESEKEFLEKPIEMMKNKKCVADLILDKNIKTPEELVCYINKN
jgi:glutamate--cysteine ligase